MDSRADPCADPGSLSGEGGPGPTARIKDPHMGPIHTYVHAYTHTCTHARTHTQARECSCTGRWIDIHVHV